MKNAPVFRKNFWKMKKSADPMMKREKKR